MQTVRRRSSALPDAFEQFPAHEFDAWIGGLKEKIRSGLNAPLPDFGTPTSSVLDRYADPETRTTNRKVSDASSVSPSKDKGKARMEGERPVQSGRFSSPIILSDDEESRPQTVPRSSEEGSNSEDEVAEVLDSMILRSPSLETPHQLGKYIDLPSFKNAEQNKRMPDTENLVRSPRQSLNLALIALSTLIIVV